MYIQQKRRRYIEFNTISDICYFDIARIKSPVIVDVSSIIDISPAKYIDQNGFEKYSLKYTTILREFEDGGYFNLKTRVATNVDYPYSEILNILDMQVYHAI